MPQPNQATIEHSVTWTSSRGQDYTLHLTLSFVRDPNYGADADGRRGTSMWFQDDCTIDHNPFTLSEMGQADYDEWLSEGPSLDAMIDQAWDEAELD